MGNKKRSKIKRKANRENKWKLTISICTVLISLATLVQAFLTFANAQYYKNIEYEKEDNLYIIRSIVYTDDEMNESEYIYSLCSSEDISNYSNITIHPFLHVYIKDGNEDVIDSIFISLPDLYELCPPDSIVALFSFKDISYPELFGDSFFRAYTKYYNTETNDLYMDSDIIYEIQYRYNSKRNKFLEKKVVVSRNYDFLNGLERTYLFVDFNLSEKYEHAVQSGQVYELETIKKFYRMGFFPEQGCSENPEEHLFNEMLDECFKYIDDFQRKYHLSDYIEKLNESTR